MTQVAQSPSSPTTTDGGAPPGRRRPVLLRVLRWLTTVVCTVLLAPPAFGQAGKATVYVYLPTKGKPALLEKALVAALPNVEVTAFGRVADFKTTLAATPPDAVITLRPMLEELKMPVALQGTKAGAAAEPYLILAVENALDRKQLAEKTIGMVDLLGRKRMGSFLGQLLKINELSQIQTVIKVEDLLPMLQFKTADAVFLPEAAVSEIAGKSALALKITKYEDLAVGLAAVAFPKSDQQAVLLQALKALPKDLLTKLGVDAWQVRAP